MRRFLTCLALSCGCAVSSFADEPVRLTPVQVLQSMRSAEQPLLRANAIEALAPRPEAQLPSIKAGLLDANEGVRFVAVVSLGDSGACDLVDLVRPLADDPSPSVRAAALYALAKCGQQPDLGPIAPLLLGDDATARANTAFLLGKLGNPSAAGMLEAALAKPIEAVNARRQRLVELTIAEALVRLGQRSHLEEIRAAFFGAAEDGELIAVAAQMAGNLRDVGLGHALEKLAFDSGPRKADPELRLIAVEALGAMNTLAAQPDIAMTFVDSPATRVRAQAAAALRWGSVQGQEAALWQLLADEDPFVATAAAKALLNRGSSGAAAIDETAPRP